MRANHALAILELDNVTLSFFALSSTAGFLPEGLERRSFFRSVDVNNAAALSSLRHFDEIRLLYRVKRTCHRRIDIVIDIVEGISGVSWTPLHITFVNATVVVDLFDRHGGENGQFRFASSYVIKTGLQISVSNQD